MHPIMLTNTNNNIEYARTCYKAALIAYSHQDYNATVAAATNAITADPAYADAYALLGRAHRALGQYEKAIVDLNAAIACNALPLGTQSTTNNNESNSQTQKLIKELVVEFVQVMNYYYWQSGMVYSLIKSLISTAEYYHSLGRFYDSQAKYDKAIWNYTAAISQASSNMDACIMDLWQAIIKKYHSLFPMYALRAESAPLPPLALVSRRTSQQPYLLFDKLCGAFTMCMLLMLATSLITHLPPRTAWPSSPHGLRDFLLEQYSVPLTGFPPPMRAPSDAVRAFGGVHSSFNDPDPALQALETLRAALVARRTSGRSELFSTTENDFGDFEVVD